MNKLKNLHLIISTVVVIPIAFVYGSGNNRVFEGLFDFTLHTTDMHNIFRAIMCLYLAIAGLWIAGIFYPGYWQIATISNFLFMLALALGRLISFSLDGTPSVILIIGFGGEALLALFAWLNLRKYKPI
jgi:phosphoglycerol transferase MdoB-like AlkP superfamily enzyme